MKWIKKVSTTPLEAIAKVIDSLSGGENERQNAPSIKAVNDALDLKQDFLNYDTKPTAGSANPVSSGGLLEYLKGEFLNTVYPVGSIYLSTTTTNPATLFGGIWEQEKGRYLYAGGDSEHTINSRGGETSYSYTPEGTVAPHKLTIDEIPAHTHEYADRYADIAQTAPTSGSSTGLRGINTSVETTQEMGGDGTHSHEYYGTTASIPLTPTYYSIAVWRRVA